jgi:hypothetical protein
MARPLLPPNGIFIPTRMIYNTTLPPALLHTWIQLRGLAWGSDVTPCLPFKELASIIGKSPATLYRHMAQLRHLSALSWRTTGSGSLIVSFPKQASQGSQDDSQVLILSSNNRESLIYPGETQPTTLSSQNRELPNPPSINPLINPDSLHISEMISDNQESDQIIRNEVEAGGERECEGERGLPILNQSTAIGVQTCEPANQPIQVVDPVSTYRSLTHLTPNASQRRILSREVTDLPLWYGTLQHWLMHGWNPRNLTGMLELYARGGTAGCRYCHREHTLHKQAGTPLQRTLAAIEAVRKKQAHPTAQE